MKKCIAILFLVGISISMNANAWFFIWIPLRPSGSSSATTEMPTTKAKLELTDSWVEVPKPSTMNASYGILMAKNNSINSSLQLFSVPMEKITDPNIENWVNSMMLRQYSTIGNPTKTPINRVVINGSQAWQSEVEGDDKDGVRYSHLKTIYTGQGEMVLLSIDTLAENFPGNKSELYKMAASMSGLSPVVASAKQPTPISLDDSKTKCADLGFKQGTEAFGKCVLKLSK